MSITIYCILHLFAAVLSSSVERIIVRVPRYTDSTLNQHEQFLTTAGVISFRAGDDHYLSIPAAPHLTARRLDANIPLRGRGLVEHESFTFSELVEAVTDIEADSTVLSTLLDLPKINPISTFESDHVISVGPSTLTYPSESEHEALPPNFPDGDAWCGAVPCNIAHLFRDSSCHNSDGTFKGGAANAGTHSTIFVIDTGIYTNHHEFDETINDIRGVTCTRRVGKYAVYLASDPYNDGIDRHGHGTHVAATAGGAHAGVAPCASLYSIKVLGDDGFGWSSDTWRAANSVLEYVTNTATADEAVIINMSLGSDCASLYYGGCTETDYAGKLWRELLEAGVIIIAAAGNDDENTCNHAPSTYQSTLAVTSSTLSNEKSLFSNYGAECSDLDAVGSNIWSSGLDSSTDYDQFSGTSMASPAVAGLFAISATQLIDSSGGGGAFSMANVLSTAKAVQCQAIFVIKQKLYNIPLVQTTCGDSFVEECAAFPHQFECAKNSDCGGTGECMSVDSYRGVFYGTQCCQDIDNGATDRDGDGCSVYLSSWCGKYDDDDFSSNTMCCLCGGGHDSGDDNPSSQPSQPSPSPSSSPSDRPSTAPSGSPSSQPSQPSPPPSSAPTTPSPPPSSNPTPPPTNPSTTTISTSYKSAVSFEQTTPATTATTASRRRLATCAFTLSETTALTNSMANFTCDSINVLLAKDTSTWACGCDASIVSEDCVSLSGAKRSVYVVFDVNAKYCSNSAGGKLIPLSASKVETYTRESGNLYMVDLTARDFNTTTIDIGSLGVLVTETLLSRASNSGHVHGLSVAARALLLVLLAFFF